MPSKITIAINDRYDAHYIIAGKVPVDGFDLDVYDYSQPGRSAADAFNRQFQDLVWDLVDMPFTNFLIAKDLGRPVVGLPTFPTIFNPILGPMVNRTKNIQGPKNLEGRKVGTMGLAFNPATWVRGILQHHYGVDIFRLHYVENEPNSMSNVPYPRPSRFSIEPVTGLMNMLNDGTVDCVFMSDGGLDPTDKLDRLFPDYWKEVQAYFDATGVLPVNSVLVAKQETLERNPGLATAIANAFSRAWDRYSEEAQDSEKHMGLEVSELRKRRLFPHRDGLQPNLKSVERIIQYTHEQGFIKKRWDVEELFAKV